MQIDHKALRLLIMNFRNPEGQTARWIEILGIYMTLKLSTAKGKTMEMQINFPDAPVTTTPLCLAQFNGMVEQLNEML